MWDYNAHRLPTTEDPESSGIWCIEKEVMARRRNHKSSSVPCITHQPILAHIIRRSDGTGGLSTADLNAELAVVNA